MHDFRRKTSEIWKFPPISPFFQVLATKDVTEKILELTQEGIQMADEGSHEYRVYEFIGADGAAKVDVEKQTFGKIGISKAMAARWVSLDKASGKINRQADNVVDTVRNQLEALRVGSGKGVSDKEKADLKKRKLISEATIKGLLVSKGAQFTTTIAKQEADLTPEMIQWVGEPGFLREQSWNPFFRDKSWQNKKFKAYNFDSLGVVPASGHLHPLMKVRSEFRQIFFSMGFSEMATNRYVESSFWNFDALFQPQQHPARDAHDTFFVSDPAVSTKFPMDYLERVKMVHSKGGYGSAGYNYDWKIEEAQKNVLRTHTTAVSARQLYQLAQEVKRAEIQGKQWEEPEKSVLITFSRTLLISRYQCVFQGFKPSKLFSIDRVFRNETLDATHLAEFHQVEGVIAEKNLSLAHLIGIFTEFFKKLGITNLRFKPTYNPYTEPSMEIFAYHDGLKKWVEVRFLKKLELQMCQFVPLQIGNSGMFRPEMLLPMGLPEDVNVAGYGLSLERPTMIKYGINNIRDLFGSKIDLQVVYNTPICRLDKWFFPELLL